MTVRRPQPAILANHLHALAKLIETNGEQPRILAAILAARGWPTATLGIGARSSDTTSSTERAALDPDQWVGVADELARAERLLWSTANLVESYHARIMAHASDDDPIPAGTGYCILRNICEHFCNPRKNPEDRLKRGLCPTHHRRWLREDQPDLTLFVQILTLEVVA